MKVTAKNSLEPHYRKIAVEMIMAAVKSADPAAAVNNSVFIKSHILHIKNHQFPLSDYKKIFLFGMGKAAASMCRAFERILWPDDGLVITKKGDEIDEVEVESIPVYQAFHPKPREENLVYSNKILEKISSICPEDKALVILMISGGGSALFEALPKGITIEELSILNEHLIKCGAPIDDINTIRKHVSKIKGGRFGKLVSDRGGTVISLIFSDVIGDDLSVIASGPTYTDNTTFKDAINLLQQYKIWEKTPSSIKQYLKLGLKSPDLKAIKEIPVGVYNYLIGSNQTALIAAKEVALNYGFNAYILTGQNKGEAKEVAKAVMAVAREIQDTNNPFSPPAALILGGEMTVKFAKGVSKGPGGPNREFVLSSAIEIKGRQNIVVAAADTDGRDGQGKSGAIADGNSVFRCKLDPYKCLTAHNSQEFFDVIDDSLEFTSSTNVNDIIVVLVG